jgi:N-glycosylase/DNA lyase
MGVASMSGKPKAYFRVAELRAQFEEHKPLIRQRLKQFAAIRPDEYFYELAYCLLTPQSSAVNAGKAIEALKAVDILGRDLDAAPLLRKKSSYIRFHNTKARHLNEMKRKFPEIFREVCNGSTSSVLRGWLVDNVNGLGWKEASHFLRNIGHRDLAILDRHILRNLKRHNVIRTIPKTLTSRRYHVIEAKFAQFAEHVGIAMDELDLLFWRNETGEILK